MSTGRTTPEVGELVFLKKDHVGTWLVVGISLETGWMRLKRRVPEGVDEPKTGLIVPLKSLGEIIRKNQPGRLVAESR